MKRLLCLAAVVWLCAQAAIAQSQQSCENNYPRFEFFAGYSAIAPTNSRIQYNFEGGNAVVDGFLTPDGYELSVIGNPTEHVGIVADFDEYFRTLGGLSPLVPEPMEFDSRTYNFLFGPQVRSRNPNTRFTPFAHTLFGLQHVDATFRQGGAMSIDQTVSNNAFAMGLGGGLDVRLTDRVSLRGQVDYAPSFYFSNPITSDVRQDLIRFAVGVLFH